MTQNTTVKQAHGGALLTGGQVGNRGGSGRPSNELRERLRVSLDERVAILESIADDPDASARDRIKSIDTLARYGLGSLREVAVEDVRGRLRATIELLKAELDEDQADHMIGR